MTKVQLDARAKAVEIAVYFHRTMLQINPLMEPAASSHLQDVFNVAERIADFIQGKPSP